jgi:hypothetical protein
MLKNIIKCLRSMGLIKPEKIKKPYYDASMFYDWEEHRKYNEY